MLREGRYRPAPLEESRLLRSRALPGFWLHADWLLAHPLPPATDCLNEILRAEPHRP